MPDEKDEAVEGKAPEAPTPSYVTKDELSQMSETLMARIEGLVSGLRSNQPAPSAPAPSPATISLAEINDAVSEGRGAAEKIAALVDARVREGVNSAMREHVEPIRTYGLPNLAAVAKTSALASLNQKHVKRYEKEINAFMANMAPEVQGNPDAWKRAYALAVGEHHDEIVREEVEAVRRQAAAQPVPPAPSGASGPLKDDEGNDLPSLEEFAGPEATRVLRDKGINTLDALASKMGYKDAREYLKLARQIDNFDGDLI